MKRRSILIGLCLAAGPLGVARAWAQSPLSPSAGLAPESGFPLRPGGLAPERDRQEILALMRTSRRRLAMFNSHTSELYSETYYHDEAYDPAALAEFSTFMRDWREEQILPIDPELMDLLAQIQRLAEDRPMMLLSGYRTPATNAALAAAGEGTAEGEGPAVDSLHIQGKAADIAIEGMTPAELGALAIGLGAGGVGIYEERGFVHIDIGPVRQW